MDDLVAAVWNRRVRVRSLLADLACTKYSPGQPRDAEGKWVGSGVSGGVSTRAQIVADIVAGR